MASSEMSLSEALSKPTPPKLSSRGVAELTSKVVANPESASVELHGADEEVTDAAASEALVAEGLNPAEWEATGFTSSRWTMATGEEGVSRRFTFKRKQQEGQTERPDLSELFGIVDRALPAAPSGEGGGTAVVALGDMQFGKDLDGDKNAVEHAVERTIRLLHSARLTLSKRGYSEIIVAWLGDHIEGFVSQGGSHAWRTTLTLSEQLRLTRRVMLKAVELFAPLANRVTFIAVPGNHGEPQRFNGKGVTRYDDSHDTEALLAVADACSVNPQAFGHVSFFVPETDEMTVTVETQDGTRIACAHGHQWKPSRHFEWWKGQSFHNSPLSDADVLLAGHLHHLFVEVDGRRTFIQAPALEQESTWYRHRTGSVGNPGLLLLEVDKGQLSSLEVLR